MKRKEHERLEAARLILQLAQGKQMVDAFLDHLDVPVHHGGICTDAEFVRRAHTVKPLRARRLVRADDFADAVGENLRAAAGEGRQTCRLQCTQNVADGSPLRLRKVRNLHGRECLDVRMRKRRAHLPHHALVVGKWTVGMQCAHDMDLREARCLFRQFQYTRDIVRFHNIAARIALLHLERAERAVRAAYIREIDMAIHRIVDVLPACALLRRARPRCEREEVVVLVEGERILPRQPRPALGGGTGSS